MKILFVFDGKVTAFSSIEQEKNDFFSLFAAKSAVYGAFYAKKWAI